MKTILAALVVVCVGWAEASLAQESGVVSVDLDLVGAAKSIPSFEQRLFDTPSALEIVVRLSGRSGEAVALDFASFKRSAEVRLFETRGNHPRPLPIRAAWRPMPEARVARTSTELRLLIEREQGMPFQPGEYRILLTGLDRLAGGALDASGEPWRGRIAAGGGEVTLYIEVGPATSVDESILEYMQQARTAGAEGRLQEALASYRLVLGLNPSHIEALHMTGDILFESDRMPEAVSHYSRAFEAQQKAPGLGCGFNGLAHSLAVSYLVAGRRDHAEAVLARGAGSAAAAREGMSLAEKASKNLEATKASKRLYRVAAGER